MSLKLKRNLHLSNAIFFQPPFFRGHVSFRGSKLHLDGPPKKEMTFKWHHENIYCLESMQAKCLAAQLGYIRSKPSEDLTKKLLQIFSVGLKGRMLPAIPIYPLNLQLTFPSSEICKMIIPSLFGTYLSQGRHNGRPIAISVVQRLDQRGFFRYKKTPWQHPFDLPGHLGFTNLFNVK